MLKFRALKVQFKNVFLIMKEHVHSIVKKANFHLLYTFILNILFWARKTDNDTLSVFKISITVHVIISTVLLHFATFQKSHHTPKNMPICQHPLSFVARWIFSSPAFFTWNSFSLSEIILNGRSNFPSDGFTQKWKLYVVRVSISLSLTNGRHH